MTVHAKAALAGDFDQSRCRTGWRCQRNIGGAKGHAAHRPIDTGALVFAARAKVFSILIHAAVVFAGAAFQFGPADSMETGHIVAIVTLQALVMVTGFAFMAVVI